MNVPERVLSIAPAFMDQLGARVAALRTEGGKVINLGQGVSGFPPVKAALEAAQKALAEPTTHVYSGDAGLLPLRDALSAWLAQHNGVEVDPEQEVIITAGANQGFILALLTLLEPGDKVLLPSPFYFNHEMSIRIVGAVPIEVPLREETGFQLTLDGLEPYLEPQPRALVFVSPNNPTGAVYHPQELQRIARELAARGIAIILDETYQAFVYDGARHFNPGSIPEARSQVISVGSFSKTFSLAGWRVGYLIAEPHFVKQAIKVQDSMLVCAPVISQRAALGALLTPPEELARRRNILAKRRQLLARGLAEIPRLRWHPTSGAYYAFMRVEGCTDSVALAWDLLERAHLAVVPGSIFGRNGEGYLRLSYGSVEQSALEEACGRLDRYFKTAHP
ncbi:MAG: aminotransferase class I/II-fold pyridoxal phosphate-dependent enzyme [Anaerolineae bacterium]|nr:aminotransferase class I/II-fold pyridoxal phosphate-dependent enzyme [Anaerolineae bacterium]